MTYQEMKALVDRFHCKTLKRGESLYVPIGNYGDAIDEIIEFVWLPLIQTWVIHNYDETTRADEFFMIFTHEDLGDFHDLYERGNYCFAYVPSETAQERLWFVPNLDIDVPKGSDIYVVGNPKEPARRVVTRDRITFHDELQKLKDAVELYGVKVIRSFGHFGATHAWVGVSMEESGYSLVENEKGKYWKSEVGTRELSVSFSEINWHDQIDIEMAKKWYAEKTKENQ